MSDEPSDGLDRRSFMISSLATVGASAALAAATTVAGAQDAAPAPADTAMSGASQGTVYTGDVIQGKKVISALDVDDLEPGRHLFYFQGVQMPTGQYWYVSVIVVKGARPGKRVLLTSGVHGDEMSPVHTIQTVMNQLQSADMSGAVVAVTDISRPALEAMSRRWSNSGRGADLIDMNREWPGNENGASATSRHAGILFNRLLKPNADIAIDFHTGTTGLDITALNIGEMDRPEIKAMMELYPIDHIWDDPTYPGVLARELIAAGIPAFTPEIGRARILDREMIALFVEGTMNVLKLHGVIEGAMGRTGKDSGLFIGNSAFPVLATQGGIRRVSGQAQRQGRGRAEAGGSAQCLWRGRCGVRERCRRRGGGPAQRCDIRARRHSCDGPFPPGGSADRGSQPEEESYPE